jgi:glycosyltransferase involved in cell wall biosynthesis
VAEASAVLANGLAARGHEVAIATARHPKRSSQRKTNPCVFEFDVSGGGNFRQGLRGECESYRTFIREHDCDVMVFECWDVWSTWLAKPLLNKIKAKTVLVSHGFTAHIWVPFSRFAWGLGPWLGGLPLTFSLPFDLRRYDHVVFLSRRAAWDRFLDHWVARVTGFKRFSIIPNGAHRAEFAECKIDFRATNGIGPGPMFMCVANYCDRKNQKLALRSFREANIEGSTLVFIGSELNDYARDMMRLDEELRQRFSAGRVMIMERVSRAATCAAYMAADVFVLAAKAETQPIVLLEAMASGMPFISTDTGCVRELPGGVIVRTESEMIAQMRQFASLPDAREKLAKQGREASRTTYDWDRVIDRYEELLLDLVANRRPRITQEA